MNKLTSILFALVALVFVGVLLASHGRPAEMLQSLGSVVLSGQGLVYLVLLIFIPAVSIPAVDYLVRKPARERAQSKPRIKKGKRKR